LLGAGAALITAAAPGAIKSASAQTVNMPMTGLDESWTGPGGIGDYGRSNGNTHAVLNAAHGHIRNRDLDTYLDSATDTGEVFDLVVVGAGISGLTAAYTHHRHRPKSPVLLLDQHAVFGGEAKQNEFDVDGVHFKSHGELVVRGRQLGADVGAEHHRIAVVAEEGFARATFARIRERAGLSSTRLISYHFAGKADFAECDEAARQGLAAQGALDREHHCEVGRRLADANAADSVDEHVLIERGDAGVAVQHREHHCEPVTLDAHREPPRARPARIDKSLDLDQQRPRALEGDQHA
jgi:hypothetical protein